MELIIILILGIFIYIRFKNASLFTKMKDFIIIITLCSLVISIIGYPKEAYLAAKSGVDTWINIVFPALLPFFIGAELLVNLGVVNFIGVLLEPIIRPVFNVPGEGSFVLAMSITSGYPIGVKLATQLRSQGRFSKVEAQRLMSFCSTSGPLFMIGAVSIGMFNNLQLGSIIAFSHYLGAIATGVLFRFYRMDQQYFHPIKKDQGYITRAFREMFDTLQKNEKTFGALLGSSVKNSIETLLVIGGFIIMFSVIIKLLSVVGIIHLISNFIQTIGFMFHIQEDTCNAIASGIFEITIGCKLLSEVHGISFLQQAVLSTMIISWSGFSIHAQGASIISKSDLSTGIYIFSKFIHTILSGFFVFLVLPITNSVFNYTNTPVFHDFSTDSMIPSWTTKIIFSSELFITITLVVLLFAISLQILYRGFHTLKNFNKK